MQDVGLHWRIAKIATEKEKAKSIYINDKEFWKKD